ATRRSHTYFLSTAPPPPAPPTLSLHAALPIARRAPAALAQRCGDPAGAGGGRPALDDPQLPLQRPRRPDHDRRRRRLPARPDLRSAALPPEHQSLTNLVRRRLRDNITRPLPRH